jgi:hypothetical protein
MPLLRECLCCAGNTERWGRRELELTKPDTPGS